MNNHSWQEVGDTEWCCQCGTSRTAPLPEWSTETGDVVQIRTYFQVGEPPRKIVEGKGSTDCQVLSSHVSRAIGAWLNLKEQNGKATRGYSFHVDAKHSSLLHRLLTGGLVFKEAPPVAYSYPWVELLVNKRDDNLHMVKEHQYGGKGPVTLLINQVSWSILEKLGPAEWIVTYSVPDLKACAKEASSGGNCYTSVWAKTKWRVWRSGTRPNPNANWQLSDEQAAIWSIELFEGTVPETFETSGKRVLY